MACDSLRVLETPVAELRRELSVLRAEFDLLDSKIHRFECARVRERITRIESILDLVDPVTLIRSVAILQEQVTELKKWREETERKRWQFWLGVGICTLTLTAILVTNFLLDFARKIS